MAEAGGLHPETQQQGDFFLSKMLGAMHKGKTLSPGRFLSAVSSFQARLAAAKHVCVLTGAGISAESGIPTFRGAGGLWRTYQATDLATPRAFSRDPSLVWEFYHYRREVVARCQPNDGHFALAALQRKMAREGRKLSIITQNIDRLHQAAGCVEVTELHGSLWLLKRPTHTGFLEEPDKVWEDRRVPLAPCFEHKCKPDPDITASDIPVSELPHHADGSLLRPAVVWFGEGLDDRVLHQATAELEQHCDMLLVVGTSSVVYPAAMFAPTVAEAGKPVVEINLEPTHNTHVCEWAFQGRSGEVLPGLLGVTQEVAALRHELGFTAKAEGD